MAQTVEVRLRLLHGGRIMVERRRHTWVTWMLFLFYKGPWQDWFLINEKEYQIHDRLNYLALEFKELVTELDTQAKVIKANIKEMEDSVLATKGYSEPFLMDVSLVENKIIRPAPKQDWRAILTNDPKRKATTAEKIYGKDANLTGKSKSEPGLRTLITTDDLKNHRRVLTEMGNSLDVDEVQTWNNNRDKKQQQQSKNSRKRRPNETPEDHQFRLAAMDQGTWDDQE